MYLKFIAEATGTFKFTNVVNYSIDNGTTWVELAANTNSPSLDNHDEILWKATLESAGTGIGTFSSTADFSVEGNVMSLIYGDNYNNQTSLPTAGTFIALFKNATHLTSAENLQLPATTLSDNCYKEMFMGCTNLSISPSLSASTLTSGCYQSMFSGCTNLRTIPTLSSTSLAINCYNSMFYGCTHIIVAPSLPATTLYEGCYQAMFQGCTALTTAPTLSVTTMAKNCYNSMFYGCTVLASCPTLSATTLAEGCYQNMFRECTTITSVPALSVTTLAVNCYNAMFMGCTSITTPSALPATVMVSGCYQNMYRDCTSLTSTPSQLSSVTTLALNCWNAMFMSCTSLTTTPTLPNISVMAEACYASFLRATGITTVPTLPASPTLAKNCYYAMFMDCTNLVNNMPTILNGTAKEGCYAHMFRNCTSITSAPELPSTALAVTCYTQMFDGCTSLVTVPANLPGTTLQVNCYSYMFRNCTSLVTGPQIAATSVSSTGNHYGCQYMFAGCTSMTTGPSQLKSTTVRNYQYMGMFQNCASLTTAPTLPGTSLGSCCYRYMFQNCTSLVNIPASLPAGTIQQYSYSYMFAGCTSLTTPPVINATKINNTYACEYMFSGCTALTTAPVLKPTAMKGYCYQFMFDGCTSLTTAPNLPSTSLVDHCYYAMFRNCTNLTNIQEQLPATTIATYAYGYMFQNCTSLVTAPEINGTSIPTGYNCIGMFQGCTELVTGPSELKPVTLNNNCYQQMFYGCTSLEHAPEIAGTTITAKHNNCFNKMFYGCTSLENPPSEIKVTSIPIAGSTTAGTFFQMFYGCTSLKSTPDILTTGLNNYAFEQMFQECTSLTEVKPLRATTMKTYCYHQMFYNCISLKRGPELPSTSLATYCYFRMFQGSGLEIPMELPATGLQQSCYDCMFAGCTKLKYAPALPAFTLQKTCYSYMFSGCTSLKHATILAKSPAANSCQYMFNGCTNLVRVSLGLNTLASACCNYMFQNCKSLKYVKAQFTTKPSTSYTNNWMNGVPAGGTFVKANGTNSWNVSGVHGTPSGWTIKLITENTTLRFNIIDDGDIKFYCAPDDGETSYTKTISISSDAGTTWTEITSSSSGTSLGNFVSGETVFVKGNNLSYDNCWFDGTAEVGLTGNIQNLVYGDSYQNRYTSSAPAAFRGLFSGYTKLTNIDNLIFPVSYIYDRDENYCESMFENCGFTSAAMKHGELLAMKLSKECYKNMFYACSSLTTPTQLPALLLEEECYKYMFANCGNLEVIPNISIDTMAPYSCENMFSFCMGLTSISEISAKEMAPYCCKEMFSNCSYLSEVDSITTDELSEGCYERMFYNCVSLSSPPSLSNLKLAKGCYKEMFRLCTSLTYAPTLPAKTLINECYNYMFKDCSSLHEIKGLFTTQPDPSYTLNWVENVAETGTFYKSPDAEWMVTGLCGIPIGWVENISYEGEYFTIEAIESCNISFMGTTVNNVTNQLTYSSDNGETWSILPNYNAEIPGGLALMAGNKVLLRGNCIPNSGANQGIGIIKSVAANGSLNISGNVMSLLYGDNFVNKVDLTGKNYVFYQLLFDNKKIINAENLILPATILSQYCYFQMFKDCTNLISAPKDLPGTPETYCYGEMFKSCTSLENAPSLPIVTLTNSERCYYAMFSYCTNLVNAPELPAMSLGIGCYNYMFNNCTSLVTAPELPAKIMNTECYYGIFNGCTSLQNPPNLRHITQLAPTCFESMFNGCTSLTMPPNMANYSIEPTCYFSMFMNCTNLLTAPALPATTLKVQCYYYMFYGCTSLKTAPDLPATTLVEGCYNYMFKGCSELNYIKAMFITTPSTTYTDNWVDGVANSGTFIKNSAATWNVTGVNGVPTNWTSLSGSPESYTYIDPTYLASYENLIYIMNDASFDVCNNFILNDINDLYNKSLIINNWKKTFPFAGEISFWKQMVNSNYINFTDSAYNSMFNNYYQWENISYVKNDYGDWAPYTVMQTSDTRRKDLIANINILGLNSYSYPQGALWSLNDFSILDFFEISSGERSFPRSGTVTYINEREYNNISLFLISIYTYLVLSPNYGDFGEIHIINEEYLNNITINITKTIVCVPEYIGTNPDDTLRRITYNDYHDSGYTSNWILDNNHFQSWGEFVNYISSDLKCNSSYRILFPLILIENVNIAYCSWVIELSLETSSTININSIQSAINSMYGNAYFINKTGFRIQGIYVSEEDWHYKENSSFAAPTKKKAYIHCTNGPWAPGIWQEAVKPSLDFEDEDDPPPGGSIWDDEW